MQTEGGSSAHLHRRDDNPWEARSPAGANAAKPLCWRLNPAGRRHPFPAQSIPPVRRQRCIPKYTLPNTTTVQRIIAPPNWLLAYVRVQGAQRPSRSGRSRRCRANSARNHDGTWFRTRHLPDALSEHHVSRTSTGPTASASVGEAPPTRRALPSCGAYRHARR
jgi:hypothetical protein